MAETNFAELTDNISRAFPENNASSEMYRAFDSNEAEISIQDLEMASFSNQKFLQGAGNLEQNLSSSLKAAVDSTNVMEFSSQETATSGSQMSVSSQANSVELMSSCSQEVSVMSQDLEVSQVDNIEQDVEICAKLQKSPRRPRRKTLLGQREKAVLKRERLVTIREKRVAAREAQLSQREKALRNRELRLLNYESVIYA